MTEFAEEMPGMSSKTERFLAACNNNLFEVPRNRKFDRDTRQYIEGKLTLDENPTSFYSDYNHPRLFRMLDAFAKILVSQPSGESVAVAIKPTKDGGLTIYLGENGCKDGLEAAETHLRDIWDVLQRIRAFESSIRDESKPTPSNTGLGIELHSKCYAYSAARLRWHYNKAMHADMLNMLKRAVTRRGAQKMESQRTDADEKQMLSDFPSEAHCQFMPALIKALETYEQYISDGGEFKSMLRAFFHANSIRMQFGNSTEFLNSLLPLYASKAPYNILGGKKFERLAEKLLSLDASIRQLLSLPSSKSLGHILDNKGPLVIVRVPAQTKKLEVDFRTDKDVIELMENLPRPMSYSAFVKKLEDKSSERIARSDELAIHAECSLLAYLIDNDVKAYHYIGVSKLCCVGCWLFFEAYNRIAVDRLLDVFYVRGSDSKVCPWVSPTSNLTKDILQTMENNVERFYRNLNERVDPFDESSATRLLGPRILLDFDEE